MTIAAAIIDRHRFHIAVGSCSFQSQFAAIYLSRLKLSYSCLENQAHRRWPKLAIRALADLKHDEECVIIGTVFRSSPQKPCIIKQLAQLEQVGVRPEVDRKHQLTRLASDDDEVFLEDEVQRISVTCTADLFANLTTGVVACLRGFEPSRSNGTFTVLEVAFLEPQPMRPIAATTPNFACHPLLNSGRWVGFVSGLGFAASAEAAAGGDNRGYALALRLLGDYLRKVRLCRLFILGDCILSNDPGGLETLGVIQQARFLSRKTEADSVMAMTILDAWLAELPLGGEGDGFSVELLPGVADCVSQLLPQQPFHSLLFPRTIARFGKGEGVLVSSTNPCLSEVHSRRILATSGQTVDDVYKYTTSGDALDCMESLLHWGHMAPTCPDTLFAYPQTDTDPLLFRVNSETATSQDYPDVFVAGNQQSVQFRRASLKPLNTPDENRQGALLITVPRFNMSHTMVLLELNSMACIPLRFDISQIS